MIDEATLANADSKNMKFFQRPANKIIWVHDLRIRPYFKVNSIIQSRNYMVLNKVFPNNFSNKSASLGTKDPPMVQKFKGINCIQLQAPYRYIYNMGKENFYFRRHITYHKPPSQKK